MKRTIAAALACLAFLMLTACNKEEAPKSADQLRAERLAASDDRQKIEAMLEQNRSTALANIQTNVAGYFAANPRFQPASDWTIISHTDDYIDEACPQGSGWGWANIMNPKLKDDKGGPLKKKVFCSTTSSSLGCYIEDDFKQGPHFKQANKCNDTIGSPLKQFK